MTKIISNKQYVKQKLLDDSGKEIELQQKELRKIIQPAPTFINQFYDFLETEYLPHQHVSKWNTYHHKLLWDYLHQATSSLPDIDLISQDERIILLMTIWIQTDFSALMKLSGQDGATCEQPRQAIQDVSNIKHDCKI